MATTTTSRSWGVRTWVLAASLVVNCGLLAMLLASRANEQYGLASNEAPKTPQVAPESTESNQWALATEDASESIEKELGGGFLRYEAAPENRSLELQAGDGQQGGGQQAPSRSRLPESPTFGATIDSPASGAPAQQGQGQAPASPAPLGGRGNSNAAGGEGQQGQGQGSAGQNQAADGSESFEFTDNLDLASRQNSFSVELGSLPAIEEPPIAYPEAEMKNESNGRTDFRGTDYGIAVAEAQKSGETLPKEYSQSADFYMSELGDRDLSSRFESQRSRGRRAAWGYQYGTTWREWPRGENNIGLQGLINPNDHWQGSPDGEGLGPGAAGDKYERIHENRFLPAIGEEAVSTFSIDVDTASYANVRQMLSSGQVPPPDAVRLEELVNYFDYNYDPPAADERRRKDPFGPKTDEPEVPFAAHVETAACPWQPGHRLVRVGIKGREVAAEKRPLSNLVFLVDVSGSMNNADKLPLVRHGLKQLAKKLGENDRVAIVVYASSEGLALPSTPGTEQETILAAIDNLQAGGSTAGGAGIQLAYQIAEDNFITGGTNRVILCTDGDFNVGVTNPAELERMVEQKAKDTKVFLSCIGFGRGNLNDAMMEKITGIGNGNYYYADDQREAERIFVKGMTGMLVTIAKDVKIQVEFNPAKVLGYRLLGYENRMLKTEDFNDDTKDAGEIGAGHTVTCLYEIVPTGEEFQEPDVDELKYQHPAGLTDAAETEELLTLKMRYKEPDEDTSSKLEWPVTDSGHRFGEASTDMQFAAAVASFGMLLRDSQYKGDATYDAVAEIADSARGDDPEGDRAEFVELVRKAKQVMPAPSEPEGNAETEKGAAPESNDQGAPAKELSDKDFEFRSTGEE